LLHGLEEPAENPMHAPAFVGQRVDDLPSAATPFNESPHTQPDQGRGGTPEFGCKFVAVLLAIPE
jgi:hypothetical protein